MGISALLLAFGALVNAAWFLGFRYLAARASGLGDPNIVLGFEHRPWAAISFTRRAVFALAGPLGSYLCAAAFFTVGLVSGGKDVEDHESMQVLVRPGGPAASAGIQDFDKIVSVDEVSVHDWTQLKAEIGKHPAAPIRIVLQRNGKELTLTPTADSTNKIGIGPPVSHSGVGIGSALGSGIIMPAQVWVSTLKGWALALTGRERVQATDVKGVVRITQQARAQSWGTALEVVGVMISYFFWIPMVVALVLFPRNRKRTE